MTKFQFSTPYISKGTSLSRLWRLMRPGRQFGTMEKHKRYEKPDSLSQPRGEGQDALALKLTTRGRGVVSPQREGRENAPLRRTVNSMGTISAPLFALFVSGFVDYQALAQKTAPRHFVPLCHGRCWPLRAGKMLVNFITLEGEFFVLLAGGSLRYCAGALRKGGCGSAIAGRLSRSCRDDSLLEFGKSDPRGKALLHDLHQLPRKSHSSRFAPDLASILERAVQKWERPVQFV